LILEGAESLEINVNKIIDYLKENALL